MTKKDAARQIFGVASRLRRSPVRGDETVDFEVLFLLSIARDLDPATYRYREAEVDWSIDDAPSVETKLRTLIERPDTPTAEREAAVLALDRRRRKRLASS
jgi:hypothetical protein